MYVRLKTSRRSKHSTLQIVKGIRKGKKVRQKIVASLGAVKSKKDLIRLSKLAENLLKKLEKEGLPISNKVELNHLLHNKTIYDGFGQVVNKLMQITGFSKIIQKIQGKKKYNIEEVIKLIIVQRFDLPSSKLRTYERQDEHGFQGIDLHNLYRAMDAIKPFKNEFQKQAFETVCSYSSAPLDCFFFDVTTLYFESIEKNKIKDFGFSKDQKYNCVQIVLALVVDSQGMPIAYELFKGNLAETKTLIPVLESLRNSFSIRSVTVVCDRGLASKTNVEALKRSNFHFVIATKLRSISKKLKINDLNEYSSLPGQKNVSENEKVLFRTMPHPQYEDALLIATYSPHRARKDRKDRERLIKKLKEKIQSSNETSIKKVISNGGYKKYTNVKKGSKITIDEKAIEEDSTWDGYHGIAVSNSANLSITDALAHYKNLWHVEETFRIAKCTLRTRPIFHWSSNRIESHILLCFITLFFERFLELLLRQNKTPLTPDKIRYALSGVHSMYFEETSENKRIKMLSALSSEAKDIFKTLNITLNRSTVIAESVVPKL